MLESVRLGVDNDAIVAAAQRVRLVGIDCPIGWPAAFTDLLIAARQGAVPPTPGRTTPLGGRWPTGSPITSCGPGPAGGR